MLLAYLTFKTLHFAHTVCVWIVYVPYDKWLLLCNSIHPSVFLMEEYSILCEVGTESTYNLYKFNLYRGHTLAWVVSHRSVTVETQVWSWPSPCEICGKRVHCDRFFSKYLFFSCQYHSTNSPYLPPSWYRFYQNNKWAKPGNLPMKQCSFWYWRVQGRKAF